MLHQGLRRAVRRAIAGPTIILLAVLLLPMSAASAGRPGAADAGPGPAVAPQSLIWQGPIDQPANLVWSWHPDPPQVLLDLADRHRVGRLLVWVAPGFSGRRMEVSRLRALIDAAAERGIAVDALGGDPSWARRPAVAGRWAWEVASVGGFERLHLNIEPHADPQWTIKQKTLARGLIAALTAATEPGLPVDADVPFWYSTVPGPVRGVTLDAAVLRVVDSVVVMAYRPTARGILEVADPVMRAAVKAGKPAHIGINLLEPAPGSADGTLWGQPAGDVYSAIGQVEVAGTKWRTYAGVALHDAASLDDLDDLDGVGDG